MKIKIISGLIALIMLVCTTGLAADMDMAPAKPDAGVQSPDIFDIVSLSGGSLCVLTGDDEGVFYSADGGMKWSQARGLPDASLYSLMADTRENLYLATSEGVFRSEDAGAAWYKVSDLNAAFISFSPDAPQCFVKVWGKGLFSGPAAFFNPKGTERLSGPEQETEQGTGQGNGRVPEELKPMTGLPETPVQTVLAVEAGRIFAGYFGKGVYVSKDNGRSWESLNQGLSNPFVITLALGPDGALFAGTYGGGLFRLAPGVSGWEPVISDTAETNDAIVQAVAFSPDGLIIAGTREQGPVIMQGHGKAQILPDHLMARANIHSLSVDHNGFIYAGTHGHGLFVSRDKGLTWSFLPFAYLSYINRLAVSDSGTWYAAVKGMGLLRTEDMGDTWEIVPLPFAFGSEMSLAVDKNDRLFAGSHDKGVFVSEKGRAPWKKFMAGLPKMGVGTLRTSPKGTLFTTTSDGEGLFRLSEENTWEKIIASDKYGQNYDCWDIIFLPNREAVAYGLLDLLILNKDSNQWERNRFGQHFRKLWISADGRIWTERMLSTFVLEDNGDWEIEDQIPRDRYDFFVMTDNTHAAAIRLEGGVDFLKIDGLKLTPIKRGLDDRRVLTLAYDNRAGIILAGTERGLWVSDDRCETWHEIEIRPSTSPVNPLVKE